MNQCSKQTQDRVKLDVINKSRLKLLSNATQSIRTNEVRRSGTRQNEHIAQINNDNNLTHLRSSARTLQHQFQRPREYFINA